MMPPIDRRQILLTGAATPFLQLSAASANVADDTPTAFADREIAAAAPGGPTVAYAIDSALGEQAYRFEGSLAHILVHAGDAAGAMYAGLDIAEALRTRGDALQRLLDNPDVRRPYIASRGIKFNIPLDLRTPSYADGGDSNRANIPEVWEREFWSTYFDEMARHRFNVLTLWNMHPFPSMVRVPEYADIALDDVWRSQTPLGPQIFNNRGNDFMAPRFMENREVVKTITMDEKIAFWRDVMEMAARRGIKIYIITWNIYTYGTFGKHGITDAIDNPATIAYMRASVRELIKTYPLLAGIGITAGENMGSEHTGAETKEQWLWSAYGEGVRDAVRDMPGRNVQLIHRFHETQGDTINRIWGEYPGYPDTFAFSHKYSVAHMYSTTRPGFFDREARPSLNGKKSWLTVRNDDLHSLRWGDPTFAREYIVNMPKPPILAGFYMGPDGFCWGRDFLDRDTAGQSLGARRRLVMQKHWYAFALWGRLSFDPTLPDAQFQAMLAARFPGVDAEKLYDAARFASQIVPQTTCFFWRDIDLRWLPEACAHNSRWGLVRREVDTGAAFYTVADFMNGQTAPDAGILNIREWRAKLAAGEALVETSPLDVADGISGSAEQALIAITDLRRFMPRRASRDLRQTIGDFEAMAYLGRYYAAKIRGACDLALFDASRDDTDKASAIAHLEDALDAWVHYAAIHSAQYLPNFFSRVGFVDISALTAEAAKDIDIARSWTPGSLA